MSTKIFKIMIVSFLLIFVANIDGQAVDRQMGDDSEKRQTDVISGQKTFGPNTAEQITAEPKTSEQNTSSQISYRKRPLDWAVNEALSLIGTPGIDPNGPDRTAPGWRNGNFRSAAAARLARNPDGSYGRQSSSVIDFDSQSIADRFLQMALSAGNSAVNSWAEGWLRGYGQARVSLNFDRYGEFQGYADLLLPIFDSERTSLFSQIGFRTMPNDRVIGNLGLGQRWFFGENIALGGNLFLDYDFTRSHLRGGVGVEFWADWLRLSSNYYAPLTNWKSSKDYDAALVQERPARGWDARVVGYLPFYRNLGLTGSFEK
ncbi:MAG: inverse autotransporter beta domain-containing protein, partial [Deltaproteobacteria bacterium]|nr:inverse autotransporter beta domain-containing protein [Deltaproteobacteria bacterium]